MYMKLFKSVTSHVLGPYPPLSQTVTPFRTQGLPSSVIIMDGPKIHVRHWLMGLNPLKQWRAKGH